ncbi:discoidin domain-containing protein [Paenibacillus pabuli]|uniref:discoidin domain-containing protein n=1 Tax=Paenibacillus pabuli TaxID=1472 RepID=UPI001FFE8FD3|nr:discoidin domain-containing protein [Paenibacillus pabuli]UPK42511.1 discoidin domain-containing protein [Paenibacillus pabuli]
MHNVRSSIKKAWASFLVLSLLLPLLAGIWPSQVYGASNNEGSITLTADNEFTLYFNGKAIGTGNDWSKAYTFPLQIQTGKNVIAVQAKDLGSYAGLLADLSYMDENIVTDFNWKVSDRYVGGWEQPNFEDASWSRATDFGRFGASPWNQITGMPEDTSARWIWAGSSNYNTPITEGYFRISFNVNEDGLAVSNPVQSSGQFEQVDFQLKPTLPMPSLISQKLPVVNAVFETAEEQGSFNLSSQEAAQLGNSLVSGQIFLDQTSARAIKVTNTTSNSGGTLVEYTIPGVEEVFDYYDIPEQEVSLEERNIVMPDPDMVLNAQDLLQSDAVSSQADYSDSSIIRQYHVDDALSPTEESLETLEQNSQTELNQENLANDAAAMQLDDIIRTAGTDDFANCRKSGNEFVCDFKKVLVNQQNANGNKVYVEAGGKLTLITPKVTGKYGFWGNYDLKFTAGEKANIYIKGDAKFKKEVKVPILGFNINAGSLGAVSVGVFLVIGVDGSVTFEFQVDQGYTVTAGVKGKTRVFIPVKIQPYSSVDKYLTVTHKIEGQITAWAGAKAEVGLTIAGKKILEVSVFAGIEGTGKWTSSTDVPSTMSLTIDALVKGEGAVFNKSFKLFELRWNLVKLEKNPTTNPGTGTNLARNAAITVDSTFSGYSAAKINDGDRNTTLGENYSWANDRNSPLPQYVVVDMRAANSINRIDLYTSQGYPIADYDLQYWNGLIWVNLVQVTGNQELMRSHTFSAVNTTKVRVVARKGPSHQPGYVRINELEIYGNPNLARSASITADSTFSGYAVSKINDGDRSTALGGTSSWANGANTPLPQNVTLDLGQSKQVSKVDLYTTQGYVLADYDLEYWNGSSWVSLVKVTANKDTYRTHSFSPVNTSKIRIVCRTGPSHQAGYVRINELEIY